MPHTTDGIDLLLIVAALLIALAVFEIRAWQQRDRYRRHERQVHLNLMRMGGRS